MRDFANFKFFSFTSRDRDVKLHYNHQKNRDSFDENDWNWTPGLTVTQQNCQ